MNRGQWAIVAAGIALCVLSGLFPPFAEVRSTGGVYSGAGPRGRGEERFTREFRGYDFILRWTGDQTDLGGGLRRYAPDLGLLGLQWLVIIAVTGILACAVRKRGGQPDRPA